MTEDLKARTRALWLEVAIFAAVFVAASLIAALIWEGTVDLPRWQRASNEVLMGPIEATKTVGIDAVYLFVSLPIALALGAALTWWRRRTPVTTVVLIALMSLIAAALMERFGLVLGPANPGDVLRHAATGATAPVQLQVQASGVLMAWPAAAILGALLVLLLTPGDAPDQMDRVDHADSDKLDALSTHPSH